MAAEILSEKLLEVYRAKQVPESNAQFATAGFSRVSLGQSADHLFRMVVLAAYDRRPFTQAAGGFESIWGMNRPTGLAGELERARIWSIESVRAMSAGSINDVLKGENVRIPVLAHLSLLCVTESVAQVCRKSWKHDQATLRALSLAPVACPCHTSPSGSRDLTMGESRLPAGDNL